LSDVYGAAEAQAMIRFNADTSGVEDAKSSLQSLQVSVSSLTNSILLMDRMQYMNMRTQEMHQMSVNRLDNAQMHYNEVVAKYGPASQEAIKAHRNLENAQISLTRTTQMMNYEHNMFLLRTIPMVLSGITSMVAAFEQMTAWESLSEGIMGAIQFAAAAAVVGMSLYSMQQMTSQQSAPGPSGQMSAYGSPVMHSGGVVPKTGQYTLQAGESVGAGPTRGGGGSAQIGGGSTFQIYVQGGGARSMGQQEDLADQVMQAIERRKRSKYPVQERTY